MVLTILFFSCSNKAILRDYSTINIGKNIWANENLKVKRFRNGDKIPHIKDAEEWKEAGENKMPAYCYYDNKRKNERKYGLMYNWYAIKDPRNLFPIGWEIPTGKELDSLVFFLERNGNVSSVFEKETKASENFGFLLRPGGFRDANGKFGNIGFGCPLWSGTVNDENIPLSYHFVVGNNFVIKSYEGEPQGAGYIRCIKSKLPK
jgi:uncharacterized protein (TIGR02145 family)